MSATAVECVAPYVPAPPHNSTHTSAVSVFVQALVRDDRGKVVIGQPRTSDPSLAVYRQPHITGAHPLSGSALGGTSVTVFIYSFVVL